MIFKKKILFLLVQGLFLISTCLCDDSKSSTPSAARNSGTNVKREANYLPVESTTPPCSLSVFRYLYNLPGTQIRPNLPAGTYIFNKPLPPIDNSLPPESTYIRPPSFPAYTEAKMLPLSFQRPLPQSPYPSAYPPQYPTLTTPKPLLLSTIVPNKIEEEGSRIDAPEPIQPENQSSKKLPSKPFGLLNFSILPANNNFLPPPPFPSYGSKDQLPPVKHQGNYFIPFDFFAQPNPGSFVPSPSIPPNGGTDDAVVVSSPAPPSDTLGAASGSPDTSNIISTPSPSDVYFPSSTPSPIYPVVPGSYPIGPPPSIDGIHCSCEDGGSVLLSPALNTNPFDISKLGAKIPPKPIVVGEISTPSTPLISSTVSPAPLLISTPAPIAVPSSTPTPPQLTYNYILPKIPTSILPKPQIIPNSIPIAQYPTYHSSFSSTVAPPAIIPVSNSNPTPIVSSTPCPPPAVISSTLAPPLNPPSFFFRSPSPPVLTGSQIFSQSTASSVISSNVKSQVFLSSTPAPPLVNLPISGAPGLGSSTPVPPPVSQGFFRKPVPPAFVSSTPAPVFFRNPFPIISGPQVIPHSAPVPAVPKIVSTELKSETFLSSSPSPPTVNLPINSVSTFISSTPAPPISPIFFKRPISYSAPTTFVSSTPAPVVFRNPPPIVSGPQIILHSAPVPVAAPHLISRDFKSETFLSSTPVPPPVDLPVSGDSDCIDSTPLSPPPSPFSFGKSISYPAPSTFISSTPAPTSFISGPQIIPHSVPISVPAAPQLISRNFKSDTFFSSTPSPPVNLPVSGASTFIASTPVPPPRPVFFRKPISYSAPSTFISSTPAPISFISGPQVIPHSAPIPVPVVPQLLSREFKSETYISSTPVPPPVDLPVSTPCPPVVTSSPIASSVSPLVKTIFKNPALESFFADTQVISSTPPPSPVVPAIGADAPVISHGAPIPIPAPIAPQVISTDVFKSSAPVNLPVSTPCPPVSPLVNTLFKNSEHGNLFTEAQVISSTTAAPLPSAIVPGPQVIPNSAPFPVSAPAAPQVISREFKSEVFLTSSPAPPPINLPVSTPPPSLIFKSPPAVIPVDNSLSLEDVSESASTPCPPGSSPLELNKFLQSSFESSRLAPKSPVPIIPNYVFSKSVSSTPALQVPAVTSSSEDCDCDKEDNTAQNENGYQYPKPEISLNLPRRKAKSRS